MFSNKIPTNAKIPGASLYSLPGLRQAAGSIPSIHALPDMFYYLEDQQVHATTNALEGFHSRLKLDYRRHRGLPKEHRISYLNWYCYFKNQAIINTI